MALISKSSKTNPPPAGDWLDDVGVLHLRGPRRSQQDSALHKRFEQGRLLVVADGMGGEPCGEAASMSAVLGFEQGFGTPPRGAETGAAKAGRLLRGLEAALEAMNAVLEAGHGADGMATTLAAVWADREGLCWTNVGDSSIFVPTYDGTGLIKAPPGMTRPKRRNKRHADEWDGRVTSALIAGPKGEEVCLKAVDLSLEPFEDPQDGMVIVASDGLDVMSDAESRYPKPRILAPWSDELTLKDIEACSAGQLAELRGWADRFTRGNPQRFLAAVEEHLLGGRARDNATALAIRLPPPSWKRDEQQEYEPAPEAPEREVLGPALPEAAVKAIKESGLRPGGG